MIVYFQPLSELLCSEISLVVPTEVSQTQFRRKPFRRPTNYQLRPGLQDMN